LGTAICGARNIEQLESLIKTLENLPPKELVLELVDIAKALQK
jgi:aryl-alcohol dehydrogenase-like predicted oxidoreductase